MWRRVEALKAAGAERWDPGELHVVEAMLARAKDATPGVRHHLEERARRHLFSVEIRFEGARRRALDALERVERHDATAARELRHELEEGDLHGARRKAEAVLARFSPERYARAVARVTLALGLVDQRCPMAPSAALEARELLRASPLSQADLTDRLHELASLLDLVLIREGAESSHATLEVGHLRSVAPTAAGPYNPEALAARALSELAELSPTYLRAYLAELSDLEALSHLTPGPEEAPAKKPTRSRGGGAKRRKKA